MTEAKENAVIGTMISGVEISPSPAKFIDIDLDSAEGDGSTPLRPIFCLKKRTDIKDFEEREDCFILEFDPDDDHLSKLSASKNRDSDESPDISVIAEKGKVACRDYPHSRHLCVNYPFEKTPHESYCNLCYCYVCDIAAPCEYWSRTDHCHAIDDALWRDIKKLTKGIRNPESAIRMCD